MPGGRGKARRACPMCKSYKYAGNGKERWKGKEAEGRKRTAVEMREARRG